MVRELGHIPQRTDSGHDLIPVPDMLLRTLLDIAVSSLDFGSGFWDQEDTDAARAVALLLNVCPNAATPSDMVGKYPDCGHISRRGIHTAHELGDPRS